MLPREHIILRPFAREIVVGREPRIPHLGHEILCPASRGGAHERLCKASVAARKDRLHERLLRRLEVDDNLLRAAQRLCERLHHGVKPLLGRHRHPLERREGLRHERIHAEREHATAALLVHIAAQPLGEVNDRRNVCILLERQPHHDIELEIWDVCRRAEVYCREEMVFLNALVDDCTHACAPCLRRERQRL